MNKQQSVGIVLALSAFWMLWQTNIPIVASNLMFLAGIILIALGSRRKKHSWQNLKPGAPSETQGYALDKYQKDAARTMASHDYVLAELGLGMGESGEVQNKIKKIMFHGHPLNEANKTEIMEELGDVLWYVAGVGTVLGITLEDIASYNVLKLRKRYPSGFDPERSINRDS
jgi:NTP pyrophosphatase (non-canonical NTP hydrolase)